MSSNVLRCWSRCQFDRAVEVQFCSPHQLGRPDQHPFCSWDIPVPSPQSPNIFTATWTPLPSYLSTCSGLYVLVCCSTPSHWFCGITSSMLHLTTIVMITWTRQHHASHHMDRFWSASFSTSFIFFSVQKSLHEVWFWTKAFIWWTLFFMQLLLQTDLQPSLI